MKKFGHALEPMIESVRDTPDHPNIVELRKDFTEIKHKLTL